jgi:glyoxalase family protein
MDNRPPALTGVHHVTAITADASANHHFYTTVLGMRLVKRTVNQDDTSAYHLFYADAVGSPGSDLTFFEWPAPSESRGSGAVTRTALRVAGEGALSYWSERLAAQGAKSITPGTRDGRRILDFEDPEGQRLRLIEDPEGTAHPYDPSPVPAAHQVRGLGPVELSVATPERTETFLRDVLGMTERRRFDDEHGTIQVFGAAGTGSASELHLRQGPSANARQGAGGVHHVAFRMDDDAYNAWVDHYRARRVASSGPVDRFYFRSLYTREPNGILIELATDGPGFHADEPIETMGQGLALPPFLEARRAEIERGLKPIK